MLDRYDDPMMAYQSICLQCGLEMIIGIDSNGNACIFASQEQINEYQECYLYNKWGGELLGVVGGPANNKKLEIQERNSHAI